MRVNASGSYFEEYMRSNALQKHKVEGNTHSVQKVMTDRNAYLSYLEVQLERVSAACLATQSFEKRLLELEASQNAQDQKLASFSKIIQLNQEYNEQIRTECMESSGALAKSLDTWKEHCSSQLYDQNHRIASMETNLRSLASSTDQVAVQNEHEVAQLRTFLSNEAENGRLAWCAAQKRIQDLKGTQEQFFGHLETIKKSFKNEFEIVQNTAQDKHAKLEVMNEDLHQQFSLWKREKLRDIYSKLQRMDETQASNHDIIGKKIEDELLGSRAETTQMRDMIRKTLDAQQLLGTSIISLQNEMDTRLDQNQAGSNCTDNSIRESWESFREQVEADLRKSEREVRKHIQNLITQLTKSEDHVERLSEKTCSSIKQLRQQVALALPNSQKRPSETQPIQSSSTQRRDRSQEKYYHDTIFKCVAIFVSRFHYWRLT
uniref:Uncharacterized protein AlNc14C3G463 n=1 Tax=Albugo laibachii Nc14 TaxID=890382 RepID=F0VZY5_9STRA|nr:conserved hypothetical protein [Albugo laibachii Nc14]|eukprot:CCA14356.1 conserved hypothetical protein [Albugo laibachii Nc14]